MRAGVSGFLLLLLAACTVDAEQVLPAQTACRPSEDLAEIVRSKTLGELLTDRNWIEYRAMSVAIWARTGREALLNDDELMRPFYIPCGGRPECAGEGLGQVLKATMVEHSRRHLAAKVVGGDPPPIPKAIPEVPPDRTIRWTESILGCAILPPAFRNPPADGVTPSRRYALQASGEGGPAICETCREVPVVVEGYGAVIAAVDNAKEQCEATGGELVDPFETLELIERQAVDRIGRFRVVVSVTCERMD